MECHIKNCKCLVKTTDGFCDKHGYYSNCDNEYIIPHVIEYMQKILLSSNRDDRLNLSLNLWYYLTFKKEFILNYSLNFYQVIIKKGEQLIKEIENFNEPKYKRKIEKFIDFQSKIKQFI